MKKSRTAFLLAMVLMAGGTACAQGGRDAAKTSASTAAQTTSTSPCVPLETRTPNAPEQKPAFPGPTRACAGKSGVCFGLTVLAKGLERPWAVEPLPDGALLISEKPGRLRLASAQGAGGAD